VLGAIAHVEKVPSSNQLAGKPTAALRRTDAERAGEVTHSAGGRNWSIGEIGNRRGTKPHSFRSTEGTIPPVGRAGAGRPSPPSLPPTKSPGALLDRVW
jgi:hypothetical protein